MIITNKTILKVLSIHLFILANSGDFGYVELSKYGSGVKVESKNSILCIDPDMVSTMSKNQPNLIQRDNLEVGIRKALSALSSLLEKPNDIDFDGFKKMKERISYLLYELRMLEVEMDDSEKEVRALERKYKILEDLLDDDEN